ncbi:MAG: Uma2 family endonuclease [Nannocystaceae bacterium]|nr:Uma2 family endonuclease [bacterium]
MSEVHRDGGRVTVEDFLGRDHDDDRVRELVDGVVVAMAPPSAVHGRIQLNVGAALHQQLVAPCAAFVEYGVKLPGDEHHYFQADLAIVCEPLGDAPIGPEPTALIEVVSPSSVTRDRGLKVDAYRRLPTCQCILLVHTDRRRIEHWIRDENHWRVQDHIGGELSVCGARLELDAVYEGTGL